MANSKPPWHACLPAAEAAPCGRTIRGTACAWWHDGTERGKWECHKRTSRDGKPAARELWLEAKAKAEAEAAREGEHVET